MCNIIIFGTMFFLSTLKETMSNNVELGSHINQVVSELKKLKCELTEWKASLRIKVELQQRIIRKVRENLEIIKTQVNTLEFAETSSFSIVNNIISTSVISRKRFLMIVIIEISSLNNLTRTIVRWK